MALDNRVVVFGTLRVVLVLPVPVEVAIAACLLRTADQMMFGGITGGKWLGSGTRMTAARNPVDAAVVTWISSSQLTSLR